MTGLHATPELDNFEPQPGDGVQKINAEEFASESFQIAHFCQKGSIRIFGDWIGKPYKEKYTISKIAYDKELKILKLHFQEGYTMKVKKPHNILVAKSFLKILGAEMIQLNWPEKPGNSSPTYVRYEKTSRNLSAQSNPTEHKKRFDLSLSAPGLMMYGPFV